MQTILEELRRTIKEIVPAAEESIRYGIPTFRLRGNLVHFGGYKKHIGFYPGASGIETFKKDLTGFECSKGTIKFPIDKPVPFNIVREIVKFRVKQNLEKKK